MDERRDPMGGEVPKGTTHESSKKLRVKRTERKKERKWLKEERKRGRNRGIHQ